MLDGSAELKLQLLVTQCDQDQDNIISSHRHDLLPFLLLDGAHELVGYQEGRRTA